MNGKWRDILSAEIPANILEKIEIGRVLVEQKNARVYIKLLSEIELNEKYLDAMKGIFSGEIENSSGKAVYLAIDCEKISSNNTDNNTETQNCSSQISPMQPKNAPIAEKNGSIAAKNAPSVEKNVLTAVKNVPVVAENSSNNEKNAYAEAKAFAGKIKNDKKKADFVAKAVIGKMTKKPIARISDASEEYGRIKLEGNVCKVDIKETRDGKKVILLFVITDETDSIGCKRIFDKNSVESKKIMSSVVAGKRVIIEGAVYQDKYSGNELVIDVQAIAEVPVKMRDDDAEEKRVELHLHTQMSTLDSTLRVKDAIETAARWGHPAIAVTDHGVVQAFPEFYDCAKRAGIKGIFGIEGYLFDDSYPLELDLNDFGETIHVKHDPDDRSDTDQRELAVNVRDDADQQELAINVLGDADHQELAVNVRGEADQKEMGINVLGEVEQKEMGINVLGEVEQKEMGINVLGDADQQGIAIDNRVEAEQMGISLNSRGEADQAEPDLNDHCEHVRDFVVFDIETTGLKEKTDQITEIGAVKLREGKIVERFSSFVNPQRQIPPEIVELTGITDEMVADAPMPEEALKNFHEFCKNSVLVAHNATNFDVKFICEHASRYDISFDMHHIDTLPLARYLLRDLERHKLDTLTEYFGIELENHHRADCDAEATAYVFIELLKLLREHGLTEVPVVTDEHRKRDSKEKNRNHHIVLLVKNQTGLENLYKLVTYSHLNHFLRRPRIPRSLLMLHREGLIVGSACEAGELFSAVVKKEDDEKIEKLAAFYDYLEVQPVGNNAFLIREGAVKDDDALRNLNRKVVELAQHLGKPCIATGDVHFLNPSDEYYRRILLDSQKYSDADTQPPLYFKTTTEMLEEFSYLGEEKAREIVIQAPRKIAEQCEMLPPFPKETCQPSIEGAEDELVESCYEKAREIYGDALPKIVQDRLEHELGAINKYGFSSLYVTACRLVKKSNEDGYLVGSRGSVGSSLVAFLSGITEVNALQPHYVCPECKHSDFEVDLSEFACGCDLPDIPCPNCGKTYVKDGYNIPFETFLGFEGDKVPDIDLNFSGDYQSTAHKYTEVLFGAGNVFRAGTISGIQEKTAYGYVLKYFESREKMAKKAEIERLAAGCCGVKRTTGQHPGGIVVVPADRSVFEFTPLQHPADKHSAGSITTHFDFSSMHDTLVKLDILGHDDPTMIRMLQDLTGIDPKKIPLDDQQTMSIFSSLDALEIAAEQLGSKVGTFGVPEFGTSFVRRMLVETRPTTMEELVRISGLSHGTDVWTNNAQELVNNGTVTLSQAICTRDDIMTYLIRCGMDKKQSFNIMEQVRKGKGLSPDMERDMIQSNVPKWYIESCKKIKYMFPRAHAAAYVMMAFRIAYFKVHHPIAYYAAYFSVRADAFDISEASQPIAKLKSKIKDIYSLGLKASDKEKSTLTVLEVALEMKLRGLDFAQVDIMKSDAKKFIVADDKTLLPPLNSIGGLGGKAAESIVAAREGGEFSTHEDLQRRAKVGKACVETLVNAGCLQGIPESDQISLFAGFDL